MKKIKSKNNTGERTMNRFCVISMVVILSIILLLASCTAPAPAPTPAPVPTPTPAPSPAEPMVLKFNVCWGDNQPGPAALTHWWAGELEIRSGGRVKPEIYWNSPLFKAADALRGIGTQIADVGIIAIAYTPGSLPLTMAASLAGIMPDPYVGGRTVIDLLEKQPDIKTEWAPLNVRPVCLYEAGPYTYYGETPVRKLTDLKGLKLRSTGNHAKMVELFGAVPVGIVMIEAYEALQRGTIDGLVSPPQGIITYKHAEVAKYYTDIPFGYMGNLIVMNMDVYNSFPEDVKEIVQQLWIESAVEATQRISSYDGEVFKQAKNDYGWEFSDLSEEDRAMFLETANTKHWQEWANEKEAEGLAGNKVLDYFLERYDYHMKNKPATDPKFEYKDLLPR